MNAEKARESSTCFRSVAEVNFLLGRWWQPSLSEVTEMRKAVLALSALLLITGLAWAQSNVPPDLVEASRKARAERAKKKAPTTVFTNDSIPAAGSKVSTVGQAAAPPAAPAGEGEMAAQAAGGAPAAAGAAGEEAAKEKECEEQCWRGKFREQRDKIRGAQRELEILQREYNLARTQYYQDPNQAVREQYSNTTGGGKELQSLLTRISEKQAEIQNLQRELSNLEDDLRRAGGNPSWARE